MDQTARPGSVYKIVSGTFEELKPLSCTSKENLKFSSQTLFLLKIVNPGTLTDIKPVTSGEYLN
jgi:hypothetical protein